jgi:feruloyl-CoA synthase
VSRAPQADIERYTSAEPQSPLTATHAAAGLRDKRQLVGAHERCLTAAVVGSTVAAPAERGSSSMVSEAQLFAPPCVSVEDVGNGVRVLRCAERLRPYERSMAHAFRDRVAAHPKRTLAAQRGPDGSWEAVTYADARRRADALAQALLDQGLRTERPLMILSGNSLDHLVLTLAGYTAGVPVVPVSVAYSLVSRDHVQIKAIKDLTQAGMVFADDAQQFAAALDAIADDVPAVVSRNADRRPGLLTIEELAATRSGAAVDRALDAVGPESVAKILFTSGSTGIPKGVINTHRMLCANQQMLAQVWPFLLREPPVLVDWLPWSHTFGGNHNMGLVLTHGGTLYIDDGKPVPALFDRTLMALRSIQPTVYFNVPAAYAQLVPHLENDRTFAESFFSRLRFAFYAAAALPEDLWRRLRAVADEVPEREVPLTASWGCTETAPAATSAHFASARCGCIGVPLPGVAIKLVPAGAKLEVRVAGPTVTPGYLGQPDATARAFDDDGYYRTGDAVRFVSDNDPAEGLMFDGRLAENFKLDTGTWVSVTEVRSALVSRSGGLLTDAVIAGHDRAYVSALAWLDRGEALRLCGSDKVAIDEPRLREHLANALAATNAGAGSAARIARLLLLDEPPSIDAGEITDKGYINQRAVLERRPDAVKRLYAVDADPAVIVP